ncbi:MAG: lipopolysaccharide biosynthesis protein, partial [Candidatus Micrarchaeota archaeon]|nr:lipopolysaccharide biosynthesis protein [Candidatus Micrarchaeota archaeon]
AKLDESKDAVLIQVVDKAVPPDKRFKPKRRQMVLIATFTAFFISIFLCFVLEFIVNLKNNEERRQKLEYVKEMLKLRNL